MESWQICSQMLFKMCLKCKSHRWPSSQEERNYIFVNHHSPITNHCQANTPTPFSQFRDLVVSNSLLLHGLQHTKLPCPSPTPRACSRMGIGYPLQYSWASLVAQPVKNLPAMWETWVRSLGWEDPLEKEMATHSTTLAWKFSWMEKPGRLQSMGSQRVGHDWETSLSLFFRLIIAFLPRSKRLWISWLQSPSAVILETPKISHCFHCFPIYLPWSDGTRCHDLWFLNVEF